MRKTDGPEKGGPALTPRRKGQPPHQRDRTNSLPQKDRPTPTPRGEGQPIPRREGQPSLRGRAKSKKGQTLHSQKEWRTSSSLASRKGQVPPGEGKANPNHKKDGPNTTSGRRVNHHTPRRQGQPELQEGKAKTHTKKTGPIPTRRKTSQPPTTRRKNQTPHSKKKSQRNAPRRKGATPTKACQPSPADRIAFAIDCVTPEVKIEKFETCTGSNHTTNRKRKRNCNSDCNPDCNQNCNCNQIALAFTFSICGLMWSCKFFKFSIFNFQFSLFKFGHTPNLKSEI